jgi:hypothetical protein
MEWWTDEDVNKHLANLYYAAGDPASYGGVERLYQRARDIGIPATRKRVREFLAGQATYQLHRQALH